MNNALNEMGLERWYVVDGKGRVFAVNDSPKEANKALENVRKLLRSGRIPRPVDPNSLRVVKFAGEPVRTRKLVV